MEKFADKFDSCYEFFYKDESVLPMMEDLCNLHTQLMSYNGDYKRKALKFIQWRGDFLTSDRECAAFFAAYDNIKF